VWSRALKKVRQHWSRRRRYVSFGHIVWIGYISNLGPSASPWKCNPPGRFLLWMFLLSEMDRFHWKPTHTGRYPTVHSLQQSYVLPVGYHHDPRTAEPVRLPQTRSSASWVSSKGSSIHFSAFPRKCFPKNEVKLLVSVFCSKGVCEKFKTYTHALFQH